MNLFKLTFCLLISSVAIGQQVFIQNQLNNDLYLGLRNVLKINTLGINYQDLKIHTSNGELEKDSCFLRIYPKQLGRLLLSVYQLNDQDSTLLFSNIFWVSKFENPIPTLYMRTEIKLSINALEKGKIELNSHGPPYTGCGMILPIKSFKMVATRNNNFLGYTFNKGDSTSQESKDLFRKLKKGDQVLFYDIIGLNYYNEYVPLNTIKIEVN